MVNCGIKTGGNELRFYACGISRLVVLIVYQLQAVPGRLIPGIVR